MTSTYRLEDLVTARAVAVIGASHDPSRIGGRPIRFLQQSGFSGAVYPVNPRHREVQGLQCYPNLAAIPGNVDVAVVSVPAADVVGVIAECGRKGIKGAIVFSSGFGEVGAEGRALENMVVETARREGVRVVGPNCQGLVAVRQGLNLSFSSAFVELGEAGPVGLVAQSGAIGGMLATEVRALGVGLSYWISSGNEADVDAAECIEFFVRDPHTRIIAAYIENVRAGRRLMGAVAAARSVGKPVVLLRTGRSPQAARAAASHTGAAAADPRVASALLEQAGACEVRDVPELLDVLSALARVRGPSGRRLGIVTNSGGLGVIMSDVAADLGLDVPPLPAAVQRELATFLPAFGATGNPVDVTAQIVGDARLLPRALEVVLRAPEIDVVIIALAMVNRLYPVDKIARDLVHAVDASGRPAVVCWVAGAPEGAAAIRAAGLPLFTEATRCLKTLAAVVRLTTPAYSPPAAASERPPAGVTALLERARDGPLDASSAAALLAAYGLPATREPGSVPASGAVELTVAGWRDPIFGPVASVGLVGPLGLALDNRAVVPAPASHDQALAALRRAWPHEGPCRAMDGILADVLTRLSSMAAELCDTVAEVRLDSVIVVPGCAEVTAAGVKIVVDRSRPPRTRRGD